MTKNIVLCFDRFFIKPIMVLLKSIEISNPGDQFVIHVVFSGDGEKESLKRLLTASFAPEVFSFHFYEIDNNILSCCPIREGDYVNIVTYYRILLPTILPPTVERVLYLNGDMLVMDRMAVIAYNQFFESNHLYFMHIKSLLLKLKFSDFFSCLCKVYGAKMITRKEYFKSFYYYFQRGI